MIKNKLSTKIFIYLASFSLFILIFLFLFQVIFINSFYKWTKVNTIKKVSKDILITENDSSIYDKLDKLSYDENLCIELTDSNGVSLYSTNNNSCRLRTKDIKKDFIYSNLDNSTYNLINSFTKEESIVYASKLSNNIYSFISTSLIPLNSTISIIRKQLLIISIVILLFSMIVAYFISKRLSNPIIKISRIALDIANGKLKTKFTCDSDILELIDLTNSLNTMKIELSKMEELQKDLLANISHDLKTPLTMIKAYAELILDININDKDKCISNLNVIIEEVNRLNLLVNDILTLTKVENDLDKVNLSSFDLIRLIDDIINRHNIYVIKDGYSIEFIHNNIDKVMIKADKKKIEQVIYNLLNNALNYTGNDKKVIIKVIDNNTYYKVMVIDSGKGISKDECKHIFDRYYRSKKNHKRYIYGTGLGLSIVKNILLLHNYQYGVTSKINKGTTFYFKIKKDD